MGEPHRVSRSDTYPLGWVKTYIQHGRDAAVVTCQWERDHDLEHRVRTGCRDMLRTFRFLGPTT